MPQVLLGASYAGYLLDLLRTVAALAGVCLLAWLALRFLSRRGFGMGATAEAPVRVVGRVPLDGQSSLHLVRAGSRLLLIGVGRGVAPALITELDPAVLDPHQPDVPAEDAGD